MRPRIALTASLSALDGCERVHLPVAYVEAVAAGGGTPIVLPPEDFAPREISSIVPPKPPEITVAPL